MTLAKPITAPDTSQPINWGYALRGAGNANQLERRATPRPQLGAHEVLVRIMAASINYRDLLILRGQLGPVRDGLTPLSDGSGTVIEVGEAVTHWRIGDRVAPIFFRDWVSGPFREAYGPSALGGGQTDGVLGQFRSFNEHALVSIPDELDFAEAATLPCAAVTAWQALVGRGGLKAQDTVLIQGTGGVALFCLQFANAFGARSIVLSSSEEKMEKAAAMGAWATVNYRKTPDWDVEVMRLTEGQGVSHVIELGGPDTFDRSLQSLAAGGRIAQIGVFTGFGPQSNLMRLQMINADISGICVGSGQDFCAMTAFISKYKIKPIIDRRYNFDAAPEAYEYMSSGKHFGKITIDVP
ncbi:MAG: NAD(P)-dependent alcohol dehydrogenase [Rhodospirillaceae bacterium]|nr:NAD(P)-dependent alcohol dehydrogenase [Rhodospirillales bacterium]